MWRHLSFDEHSAFLLCASREPLVLLVLHAQSAPHQCAQTDLDAIVDEHCDEHDGVLQLHGHCGAAYELCGYLSFESYYRESNLVPYADSRHSSII